MNNFQYSLIYVLESPLTDFSSFVPYIYGIRVTCVCMCILWCGVFFFFSNFPPSPLQMATVRVKLRDGLP